MSDQPEHQPRAATDLSWLLRNFVDRTPGVREAVAVSADGFLLAASEGPIADGSATGGTEQFAAIISGLNSLTKGAADLYSYGKVTQLIIEMEFGNLFVMAANTGSTVGVLADDNVDIGGVAYEMALLIERVGALLTPSLIDDLKNSISLRAEA